MKEYMPYDGVNDPFFGMSMDEIITDVDEDGCPVLNEEGVQFNPDTIAVPTLPIREPVHFHFLGERVELIADVIHNLRIGECFSNDERGGAAESLRFSEFEELFSELAVAWYAYRKRDVNWSN